MVQRRLAWLLGAAVLCCVPTALAQAATAQPASSSSANPTTAASAASGPQRQMVAVPRLTGRLLATEIGLVINTADPYSVQVGEHYIAARRLRPDQVLRVDVPVKPLLTKEEFERLQRAIDNHFSPAKMPPGLAAIQALALAWVQPYQVECNAITGALAMGVDLALCQNSCAASRPSRYFNSATLQPATELNMRPSMLLAARSVEQAKALIDRGVAADGSLLGFGRPLVNVLLLTTDDAPRRVREGLYPPPNFVRGLGVDIKVVPAAELPGAKRLLMAITGSVHAPLQPAPDWVPGGLGDHLTSTGGDLLGTHGQGTALDWIASGATASHGSVSEPCNHLQKFPHPQLLLAHYLQGASSIEAYWKSVAWPQQSLFIGEPLAAPFGRR